MYAAEVPSTLSVPPQFRPSRKLFILNDGGGDSTAGDTEKFRNSCHTKQRFVGRVHTLTEFKVSGDEPAVDELEFWAPNPLACCEPDDGGEANPVSVLVSCILSKAYIHLCQNHTNPLSFF